MPDRIAFIGGGHMARALIGGLLARGTPASHISVGEPLAASRRALEADYAVRTSADNLAAISEAAVVVLAVKPQAMKGVLEPLRGSLAASKPLILSIAAGVRLAALQRWAGAGLTIVRCMPNRPALVGAGISALVSQEGLPAAERERAQSILGAAGETVWVQAEDELDVVTALSGSGPAYFFLLAEHMADAGASLGLQPEVARRLALATLVGAGALARHGDGNLERMRAEVTSKGGTTEAAVRSFEAAGLAGTVQAAMRAATLRGRELASENA